jgi:hypothetical protein
MVADFKLGLRWGHAKEWDQGEDLGHAVSHLQNQTERLRNGGQFWHIAVEEQIKKSQKDLTKMTDELASITDAAKIAVAKRKIDRARKNMNYMSSIPLT